MTNGDADRRQQLAPLIAGAAAGASNVASGYAFDTVKVRLQTGRYDGMIHCFRHIVSTEGVKGLYRGLTPPLLGGAAETGVNYLVYSRLLRELSADTPPGAPPPLTVVPVAAMGAGVALSFILAPIELLKCRLQTTGHHHTGPAAALRQLLAEEGPRGLTRGLGATLLREVPGNAIFFSTYEWLRRTHWFAREPSAPPQSGGGGGSSSGSGQAGGGGGGAVEQLLRAARSAGSAILCGGIAGVAMWGTVLPLDTAKSRLQVATPGTPWDVGVSAHLQMLAREGGARALWSGLAPTLVRAFPANAAQWLAYEIVMQQMGAHGGGGGGGH